MSLHGLSHIVMGVPNVEETAAYYEEFGLGRGEQNRFSTRDGGEQLHIVSEPRRRLVELGVRADDPDDLDRIAVALTKLGFEHERPDAETLTSTDPVTNIRAKIKVAERISQQSEPTPYNGPGRIERYGRAPGIVREDRVRPRKLGHVVSGTVDLQATTRFLVDGLGFQVSDYIGDKGAFLRCSNDHHNFLALAAPVSYLHHSSWQVDDIDDVGRGATAMLEGNPERHIWGLGRHYAGSNFFWYLKDPAGNFSEYYSDLDVIPEDEIWDPQVMEGAQGLYSWGQPPPPSFLAPEDLAALMVGAHSPR
ncbi:VOC family protein [Enemella evansiae]|uniref:VOC family protein n=1 Tax=Enemella evansiae TaxID=2016499 RepID=UPI000B96F66D|nr:VOC family protein [Enemella evansiae]OYN96152.1 dioxygenase [Enemella evansiae]OYN99817.1 dioxygenase [Enemella evansiae]OYO06897.1 dioxygenase [Enemella evansiae]PFG65373.1 glyoxalase/bleomycin resistance protein/dioxygenase superfamily protein [Propionibacteriaceae bacterium ES.041]